MATAPQSVATFLRGKRFAVAGVSRQKGQPANAILEKLRKSGFDAVPVNPNAESIGGEPCYPSLSAVPGQVDGVVVAVPPAAAAGVVRDAASAGIRQIWFHRSFGAGSVSDEAIEECRRLGIEPIVGGCPLMFCEPVDVFHRCFRWWLKRGGRIPV